MYYTWNEYHYISLWILKTLETLYNHLERMFTGDRMCFCNSRFTWKRQALLMMIVESFYSPMQGTFFLGPVFNNFVHFLQYVHFYASYDSDFFTDVLHWLWEMFYIHISCFWNDFPPFCGHLKQKFSTKSVKKWFLDKPKNSQLSIF